jgi:hypothetical protein
MRASAVLTLKEIPPSSDQLNDSNVAQATSGIAIAILLTATCMNFTLLNALRPPQRFTARHFSPRSLRRPEFQIVQVMNNLTLAFRCAGHVRYAAS